MEDNRAKNLAEQIALLLQENEKETNDFTSLRVSLEKINDRLNALETQLDTRNQSAFQPLTFGVQSSNHPSRQIFTIPEAADETNAPRFETEKICPYEPAGKPCDYCSMCSSLGF